jgi:hypothetical protein
VDVDTQAPDRCVEGGALTIGGDYRTAEGEEHWLRRSPTASMYAVVPAGEPSPSNPPLLWAITHACDRWLALEGMDGSAARLDWARADDALWLCRRGAASFDAARTLERADADDLESGCDGAAWTVLGGAR